MPQTKKPLPPTSPTSVAPQPEKNWGQIFLETYQHCEKIIGFLKSSHSLKKSSSKNSKQQTSKSPSKTDSVLGFIKEVLPSGLVAEESGDEIKEPSDEIIRLITSLKELHTTISNKFVITKTNAGKEKILTPSEYAVQNTWNLLQAQIKTDIDYLLGRIPAIQNITAEADLIEAEKVIFGNLHDLKNRLMMFLTAGKGQKQCDLTRAFRDASDGIMDVDAIAENTALFERMANALNALPSMDHPNVVYFVKIINFHYQQIQDLLTKSPEELKTENTYETLKKYFGLISNETRNFIADNFAQKEKQPQILKQIEAVLRFPSQRFINQATPAGFTDGEFYLERNKTFGFALDSLTKLLGPALSPIISSTLKDTDELISLFAKASQNLSSTISSHLLTKEHDPIIYHVAFTKYCENEAIANPFPAPAKRIPDRAESSNASNSSNGSAEEKSSPTRPRTRTLFIYLSATQWTATQQKLEKLNQLQKGPSKSLSLSSFSPFKTRERSATAIEAAIKERSLSSVSSSDASNQNETAEPDYNIDLNILNELETLANKLSSKTEQAKLDLLLANLKNVRTQVSAIPKEGSDKTRIETAEKTCCEELQRLINEFDGLVSATPATPSPKPKPSPQPRTPQSSPAQSKPIPPDSRWNKAWSSLADIRAAGLPISKEIEEIMGYLESHSINDSATALKSFAAANLKTITETFFQHNFAVTWKPLIRINENPDDYTVLITYNGAVTDDTPTENNSPASLPAVLIRVHLKFSRNKLSAPAITITDTLPDWRQTFERKFPEKMRNVTDPFTAVTAEIAFLIAYLNSPKISKPSLKMMALCLAEDSTGFRGLLTYTKKLLPQYSNKKDLKPLRKKIKAMLKSIQTSVKSLTNDTDVISESEVRPLKQGLCNIIADLETAAGYERTESLYTKLVNDVLPLQALIRQKRIVLAYLVKCAYASSLAKDQDTTQQAAITSIYIAAMVKTAEQLQALGSTPPEPLQLAAFGSLTEKERDYYQELCRSHLNKGAKAAKSDALAAWLHNPDAENAKDFLATLFHYNTAKTSERFYAAPATTDFLRALDLQVVAGFLLNLKLENLLLAKQKEFLVEGINTAAVVEHIRKNYRNGFSTAKQSTGYIIDGVVGQLEESLKRYTVNILWQPEFTLEHKKDEFTLKLTYTGTLVGEKFAACKPLVFSDFIFVLNKDGNVKHSQKGSDNSSIVSQWLLSMGDQLPKKPELKTADNRAVPLQPSAESQPDKTTVDSLQQAIIDFLNSILAKQGSLITHPIELLKLNITLTRDSLKQGDVITDLAKAKTAEECIYFVAALHLMGFIKNFGFSSAAKQSSNEAKNFYQKICPVSEDKPVFSPDMIPDAFAMEETLYAQITSFIAKLSNENPDKTQINLAQLERAHSFLNGMRIRYATSHDAAQSALTTQHAQLLSQFEALLTAINANMAEAVALETWRQANTGLICFKDDKSNPVALLENIFKNPFLLTYIPGQANLISLFIEINEQLQSIGRHSTTNPMAKCQKDLSKMVSALAHIAVLLGANAQPYIEYLTHFGGHIFSPKIAQLKTLTKQVSKEWEFKPRHDYVSIQTKLRSLLELSQQVESRLKQPALFPPTASIPTIDAATIQNILDYVQTVSKKLNVFDPEKDSLESIYANNKESFAADLMGLLTQIKVNANSSNLVIDSLMRFTKSIDKPESQRQLIVNFYVLIQIVVELLASTGTDCASLKTCVETELYLASQELLIKLPGSVKPLPTLTTAKDNDEQIIFQLIELYQQHQSFTKSDIDKLALGLKNNEIPYNEQQIEIVNRYLNLKYPRLSIAQATVTPLDNVATFSIETLAEHLVGGKEMRSLMTGTVPNVSIFPFRFPTATGQEHSVVIVLQVRGSNRAYYFGKECPAKVVQVIKDFYGLEPEHFQVSDPSIAFTAANCVPQAAYLLMELFCKNQDLLVPPQNETTVSVVADPLPDAPKEEIPESKFKTPHPKLKQLFERDQTTQNPSCLEFRGWYDTDICHALLQMTPNRANAVRVVFDDVPLPQTTGKNKTAAEKAVEKAAAEAASKKAFTIQLTTLIELCKKTGKPGIFVSKQPGDKDQNHFICGLILENQLFYINPRGYNPTGPYDLFKELQDKKILTGIWRSTTSLQTNLLDGEEGLVSCGVWATEIARILSCFTAAQLKDLWINSDSIKKGSTEIPDACLQAGPDALRTLLASIRNKDVNAHRKEMCELRQYHFDLLNELANERAKKAGLPTDRYLSKCQHEAPAQIVFNKLNLMQIQAEEQNKSLNIGDALSTPELNYEAFKGELDKPDELVETWGGSPVIPVSYKTVAPVVRAVENFSPTVTRNAGSPQGFSLIVQRARAYFDDILSQVLKGLEPKKASALPTAAKVKAKEGKKESESPSFEDKVIAAGKSFMAKYAKLLVTNNLAAEIDFSLQLNWPNELKKLAKAGQDLNAIIEVSTKDFSLADEDFAKKLSLTYIAEKKRHRGRLLDTNKLLALQDHVAFITRALDDLPSASAPSIIADINQHFAEIQNLGLTQVETREKLTFATILATDPEVKTTCEKQLFKIYDFVDKASRTAYINTSCEFANKLQKGAKAIIKNYQAFSPYRQFALWQIQNWLHQALTLYYLGRTLTKKPQKLEPLANAIGTLIAAFGVVMKQKEQSELTKICQLYLENVKTIRGEITKTAPTTVDACTDLEALKILKKTAENTLELCTRGLSSPYIEFFKELVLLPKLKETFNQDRENVKRQLENPALIVDLPDEGALISGLNAVFGKELEKHSITAKQHLAAIEKKIASFRSPLEAKLTRVMVYFPHRFQTIAENIQAKIESDTFDAEASAQLDELIDIIKLGKELTLPDSAAALKDSPEYVNFLNILQKFDLPYWELALNKWAAWRSAGFGEPVLRPPFSAEQIKQLHIEFEQACQSSEADPSSENIFRTIKASTQLCSALDQFIDDYCAGEDDKKEYIKTTGPQILKELESLHFDPSALVQRNIDSDLVWNAFKDERFNAFPETDKKALQRLNAIATSAFAILYHYLPKPNERSQTHVAKPQASSEITIKNNDTHRKALDWIKKGKNSLDVLRNGNKVTYQEARRIKYFTRGFITCAVALTLFFILAPWIVAVGIAAALVSIALLLTIFYISDKVGFSNLIFPPKKIEVANLSVTDTSSSQHNTAEFFNEMLLKDANSKDRDNAFRDLLDLQTSEQLGGNPALAMQIIIERYTGAPHVRANRDEAHANLTGQDPQTSAATLIKFIVDNSIIMTKEGFFCFSEGLSKNLDQLMTHYLAKNKAAKNPAEKEQNDKDTSDMAKTFITAILARSKELNPGSEQQALSDVLNAMQPANKAALVTLLKKLGFNWDNIFTQTGTVSFDSVNNIMGEIYRLYREAGDDLNNPREKEVAAVTQANKLIQSIVLTDPSQQKTHQCWKFFFANPPKDAKGRESVAIKNKIAIQLLQNLDAEKFISLIKVQNQSPTSINQVLELLATMTQDDPNYFASNLAYDALLKALINHVGPQEDNTLLKQVMLNMTEPQMRAVAEKIFLALRAKQPELLLNDSKLLHERIRQLINGLGLVTEQENKSLFSIVTRIIKDYARLTLAAAQQTKLLQTQKTAAVSKQTFSLIHDSVDFMPLYASDFVQLYQELLFEDNMSENYPIVNGWYKDTPCRALLINDEDANFSDQDVRRSFALLCPSTQDSEVTQNIIAALLNPNVIGMPESYARSHNLFKRYMNAFSGNDMRSLKLRLLIWNVYCDYLKNFSPPANWQEETQQLMLTWLRDITNADQNSLLALLEVNTAKFDESSSLPKLFKQLLNNQEPVVTNFKTELLVTAFRSKNMRRLIHNIQNVAQEKGDDQKEFFHKICCEFILVASKAPDLDPATKKQIIIDIINRCSGSFAKTKISADPKSETINIAIAHVEALKLYASAYKKLAAQPALQALLTEAYDATASGSLFDFFAALSNKAGDFLLNPENHPAGNLTEASAAANYKQWMLELISAAADVDYEPADAPQPEWGTKDNSDSSVTAPDAENIARKINKAANFSGRFIELLLTQLKTNPLEAEIAILQIYLAYKDYYQKHITPIVANILQSDSNTACCEPKQFYQNLLQVFPNKKDLLERMVSQDTSLLVELCNAEQIIDMLSNIALHITKTTLKTSFWNSSSPSKLQPNVVVLGQITHCLRAAREKLGSPDTFETVLDTQLSQDHLKWARLYKIALSLSLSKQNLSKEARAEIQEIEQLVVKIYNQKRPAGWAELDAWVEYNDRQLHTQSNAADQFKTLAKTTHSAGAPKIPEVVSDSAGSPTVSAITVTDSNGYITEITCFAQEPIESMEILETTPELK